MDQKHGILLLDKPKGMSSAYAIGKLKRLGQKKIGHAGTLDPMATGLIIVLLGEATKISGYLLDNGEKSYDGALKFGQITDTWDAEGKTLEERDFSALNEEMVRDAVQSWLGKSIQEVPAYSAAKHEGQALYKLARAGKETPVKTKEIFISHAEVQSVDLPSMRFRVTCSSGSYIRSLAHSLGIRLGCGATLTELTRQYSHPFNLQDAHSLESLLDNPEDLADKIIPITKGLPNWHQYEVSETEAIGLRNGNPVMHNPLLSEFSLGEKAFLSHNDSLLALAEAKNVDGKKQWHVLRGLLTD